MSFSNSLFSYGDVKQLFDQAMANERGIRVKLSKKGAAHNLRQRMSYFRQLDRRENKKVYQPDDPLYGHSQYDILVLKVIEPDPPEPGVEVYLDIIKGQAIQFQTEEL